MYIPLLGIFLYFIIAGALLYGYAVFNLKLTKIHAAKIDDLFTGFNKIFRSMGLFFIIGLTAGIGFLFFIFPGIILSLMFSQAFYIMAEDPSLGIIDCIEKSNRMMIGHKWKLFKLKLRYTGLTILAYILCSVISVGFFSLMDFNIASFGDVLVYITIITALGVKLINLIWIIPIKELAFAIFYHDIKNQNLSETDIHYDTKRKTKHVIG